MLRDDKFDYGGDEREYDDGEFQWDKKKARENLEKHGVSFEKAREAFDDPRGIIIPDTRQNHEEDRFNLIGKIGGGEEIAILVVTYTPRGEKTRIISARGAELWEKRKYYNPRGKR